MRTMVAMEIMVGAYPARCGYCRGAQEFGRCTVFGKNLRYAAKGAGDWGSRFRRCKACLEAEKAYNRRTEG